MDPEPTANRANPQEGLGRAASELAEEPRAMHPFGVKNHSTQVLAFLLAFLLSCSDSSPDAPAPDGQTTSAPKASAADVAQRDLAAALFAEDRFRESFDALKPLFERASPAAWDLNAAAIAASNDDDLDLARELFNRALQIDPQSAVAHFNLGQIDFLDGEIESSAGHYQRAHELAPADVPTELALAGVLVELDQTEAADAHYRALEKVGLDFSGSWYLTILYRYGFLKLEQGLEEQGEALILASETLRARGITAPSATDIRRGNFGRVLPPNPLPRKTLAPLDLGTFQAAEPLGFPTELRLTGAFAASKKEYWQVSPLAKDAGTAGTTGWIGWNASGIWSLDEAKHELISELGAELVLGFDIEDDGDLDLIVLRAKHVDLILQQPSGWQVKRVFELPSAPMDAVLEDFDHEGDLDLVLVGDFGVRVLRNDGAELEAGGFTDATSEAGLDTDVALEWCIPEDFDTDQDVDFLFGGQGQLLLSDNVRGAQFEWRNQRLQNLPTGKRPIVSDVDANGRPDLLFGQAGTFLVRADGSYKKASKVLESPVFQRLGDLDSNGDIDGIAITEAGAFWLPGLSSLQKLSVPKFDALIALIDADGNGAEDLVVLRDGRAEIHRRTPVTGSTGFRLFLRGIKDNRQGMGALVEMRVGDLYQRLFWRHEDQRLGLSGAAKADILRVTWPNGVVQTVLGHPAGKDLVLRQKKGLIGSCPFLYAWDGTQFTFISDVLGITPLGLPMGPGMLVPPDHDEFVLVTGEQLKARDAQDGSGDRFFELQFTEELREVTYLDKARLVVVDHPIGTEIFPNERFSFPPFPGGHTHITEAPSGPLSAVEVDLATGLATGRDWAAELAAIDGQFSSGFEAYEGRFQGLTKPHMLELTFEASEIKQAKLLRLFMTGWLYWTNASVNMAAARTPGVDFIPPIFSVPDGNGGWRDLGPPFGFPAGKTKTMIVDLTGQLDPDDPRLRVFSTLRLFWDAVRLGTDGDNAPMTTTELEPISATLWERGFSRPMHPLPDEELEWFDWSELENTPRWNQHPGRYTKFGEVLPLLKEAEDQFVILGSGDALRLRFDANLAPPLPQGWRRDFLVYLDGWAKDRDPNSLGVEFVEPMPFHGMSGFPYGPSEHFPDSPEHKAWRAEWNTRPSKTWIKSLAPNFGL